MTAAVKLCWKIVQESTFLLFKELSYEKIKS